MSDRPRPGALEQRSAPSEGTAPSVQGNTLHGTIPVGVESRDLGGWTEVLAPGCLTNADRSRLVVTVDHAGLPLGRFPGTLTIEDRDDGLHWSVDLPESRADVKEAIVRRDLDATSWRMVVGRDSWDGNRRTVHEIRELHDVAIVVNAAYPTHAELRSAPEPEPPFEEATVPDENPQGGLRVEDRAAAPPEPRSVEARILEAVRTVKRGESRDLTNATADPITPEDASTMLWDRLRPLSIALASGIRTIPTSRKKVTWPRLLTDVDPTWIGELEEIPEGDPTFGEVAAEPKKLAHRVVLSNEVIDDSEPSIIEVLNGHLATMLALKLDLSIFESNPSNPDAIRGLKYVAGVQSISMGTNGGALANYDPFITAVGMLRAANVPGPYAVAINPRTLTALELLRRETGSNEQLGAPAGLPPFYASSQLSIAETKGTASNATSAWVYAPSEVVLVRRADATLELDRSRLFHLDGSEMRAKLRADLIAPNPQAIVRIDGIIPA